MINVAHIGYHDIYHNYDDKVNIKRSSYQAHSKIKICTHLSHSKEWWAFGKDRSLNNEHTNIDRQTDTDAYTHMRIQNTKIHNIFTVTLDLNF